MSCAPIKLQFYYTLDLFKAYAQRGIKVRVHEEGLWSDIMQCTCVFKFYSLKFILWIVRCSNKEIRNKFDNKHPGCTLLRYKNRIRSNEKFQRQKNKSWILDEEGPEGDIDEGCVWHIRQDVSNLSNSGNITKIFTVFLQFYRCGIYTGCPKKNVT